MEQEKKKNMVGIVVGIIAVLLLIVLLVWNSINNDNHKTKESYEVNQLELFKASVEKDIKGIDTNGKSVDELQSLYSEVITNNQKQYGGSSATGVDAFSLDLLNNINDVNVGSVEDLGNKVTSLLDIDIVGFVTDLLSSSGNSTQTTLTLASSTVCQTVADSKYCIDGSSSLSANIYISNPNSTKWAVILHGVMMSGTLMYNSVGSMYEEQGYNIIAPDSRGHGNSSGSVAMGYLESLDVYDWIKDLNANYTRYGVNSAPDTIIIHGISLGGATTLQLATNPDIAAKKGGAYSATLEELHVKGFVDDCGYTSMSGIITGMLSAGDTSSMTALLDSLNISDFELMTEVTSLLEKFNISGFEGFTQDSYTDVSGFVDNFGNLYEQVQNATNGSNNTNNNTAYNNFSNFDWSAITNQYGGWFDSSENILDQYKNNSSNDWAKGWTNLFPGLTSSVKRAKVTLVNNAVTNNSSNFLDGVIGTALMNLVGVGLTEDNYDYYSDVFAEGRHFPANAKVVIIHGTSDTTVPHSNADTVASNVSPAKLVHKWDAVGMPHAFIVVGSNKDEYTNLIKNFTTCVNDSTCTSISR